jgi:hypothetical protein
VRRVQPDDPAAPAEAGDPQAADITRMGPGPGDAGVEVAHDLPIRDLADHPAQKVRDVAVLPRVTLPREYLGRDGLVTELGQTTTDILDVLMDTENLLHHEDDRPVAAACRLCAIGGHLAAGSRNLDLAGSEADAIGCDDGLSGNRLYCQGETSAEGTDHELASAEGTGGNEAVKIAGAAHGCLL